jgi:tRNA-Thr(GGU) m(6)t(6)A37 methyltransferase TsaA
VIDTTCKDPCMPYSLEPVGHVRSSLVYRDSAPRQADEGAPPAEIVIKPEMARALDGVRPGDDLIVLTWLHLARRNTLTARPRDDPGRPEQGVFTTRSPDRPNPIGLHRVRVIAIEGTVLRVDRLEALDTTPVIDLKPVLGGPDER